MDEICAEEGGGDEQTHLALTEALLDEQETKPSPTWLAHPLLYNSSLVSRGMCLTTATSDIYWVITTAATPHGPSYWDMTPELDEVVVCINA
jgi:hypothetical protein